MYPLGSFPEIREFAAMLERMKHRRDVEWRPLPWATPSWAPIQSPTQFVFYRHRDGVALGFSMDEWQHLRGLMAAALTSPKLRPFWEELELVYGEL